MNGKVKAVSTIRGVNDMKELAFIVLAFNSPVPLPILIGAGLVIAVVILVGAIFLFRSPGKKKGAKAGTQAGAASGWQPQGQQQQQGMQGGWNQAGAANPTDNAWGQQQPGGWGAQSPAQQQQPAGWGAQSPAQQQQQQPGGWGSPSSTQQPSANSWGTQSPAQQQQPGGWGAQSPAQQQQQQSWGTPSSTQQPAASTWGAQSPAQQPAWGDATLAPQQQAAASQTPWAQPQSASMQQQPGAPTWGGMQNNTPPQQDRTVYGGGSAPAWNQPASSTPAQPADPWSNSASPAQSSAPVQPGWGQSTQQPASSTPAPAGNQGFPSWQQQAPSQGFGNATPAMGGIGQTGMRQDSANLFNNDNDKTMLRPNPPTSVGIVRVEEGKEPGRVYEVRKESLSIGRSRESDIFLEDLAVSRLHASIVSLGSGNYALKDEGSANGTKVNGQLVSKYQTFPLQEGDKIQLGQTVLVFAKR